MSDQSYTIEEIKKRLYDPNDSIEDILGDLTIEIMPLNFSRLYINLFVSGVEEALTRKWPNENVEEYPTIVIVNGLSDLYEQIKVQNSVTVAGFNHETNQILFGMNFYLG